MERAIDKCILYIAGLYVLWQSFGGMTRLTAVYMTLAVAAAVLWLIPKDRRKKEVVDAAEVRRIIACVLMDVASALVIFEPNLLGILPLLVYDLIYSRHLIGLGLALLAGINVVLRGVMETGLIWFTAVAILLAVWLCYKTIRLAEREKQILQLRDDDEEQRQKLNRQNEQLLEARDTEVVTAQMAERNRIAREIHDNVGHTLSRALLQVGALLAIHKEEPVHTELTGVRETLDSAMNSIRSSVHDLHDSSVDLEGTVRQMTDPLKEEFQVTVDIDASQDMPRDVKYGLIGILRETISNILRHSRNDTVQISILEHPGFYQLVVHDYLSAEGKRRSNPVAGKESGTPGIGLTNIESRARALGGTVRISQENGYRVFVSVPKA